MKSLQKHATATKGRKLSRFSTGFMLLSSFTRDWLKTIPATVETPVTESERALQPKHFYSRLGSFFKGLECWLSLIQG